MTRAARVSLVLLAFLMLGPLTAGCGKWGRRRAGDRPTRQARSGRVEGRGGRDRAGATADTSLRRVPRPRPAPGPYEGHWQGTTSQGKPLSFTVEQNYVLDLTVGIAARGCPVMLELKAGLGTVEQSIVAHGIPGTREVRLSHSTAGMITITDAGFAYSSPGRSYPLDPLWSANASGGEDLQAIVEAEKAISGRFPGETTASGTLKLREYPSGKVMVQATWTAVRRPQAQPSQKPSGRP
jgi:hypothetical protein